MTFDHEEYDYSCERCGRGYFADVGWGGCPTCTPEQMGEFYREKELKRKQEEEKIRKERTEYYKSQEYLNQRDLEIQLCEDYD